MEDLVNHPKHYTACNVTATFEPIDLVEHYGFLIGNAMKYMFRAPHKGNKKLDLQKALFYLKRSIANAPTEPSVYIVASGPCDMSIVKAFRDRFGFLRTLVDKDGFVRLENVKDVIRMLEREIDADRPSLVTDLN